MPGTEREPRAHPANAAKQDEPNSIAVTRRRKSEEKKNYKIKKEGNQKLKSKEPEQKDVWMDGWMDGYERRGQ